MIQDEEARRIAEKRGYSKGYAAGTRRVRQEHETAVARAMREDFIQRMMISIAPQIIERPWGKTEDGKFVADKGAAAIMNTVRTVATEAAKTCTFEPLIMSEQVRRILTENQS